MDPAFLLATSSDDGRALLVAAEHGWHKPVPHCPGWDAEALVRHTGGIFEWMAAIVTSRKQVIPSILHSAPDCRAELSSWYLAALDRTVEVLGSADPDSDTWTFSSTGDRRVRWWCRRLAVEVAIHRHDAESAASGDDGPVPTPIDGAVAADGVDEFVVEFLPGLLGAEGVEGLNETLHLHATDGPLEWWIDLGDASAARPEHAKADTAIRATRSDLLLWLTNRVPITSLEIFGNPDVVQSWRQLRH